VATILINPGSEDVPYGLNITSGGKGQIMFMSNNTTYSATSTTSINDNKWHYLIGTYDGETLKIYVDGVFEDDDTDPSGNLPTDTGSVRIGADYQTTPANFFNGSIDEVRIFSRALSPEEINASYNAGLYRLQHNFTGLAEGNYTYRAYAQDAAGNVNSTEQRTLTVDTTKPNLWFTSPSSNQSATGNSWIFVNVSGNETLSWCTLNWYNGSWQNVSMTATGFYCYANMTGLMVGSYYFRVYGNDSAGNMNVTEDRQASVSLLQVQNTRMISPQLLVARTNETLNSTTWVKYTQGNNQVYMINITSEVPYDFTAPSASGVRVYFVDYSPYSRKDITGNTSVNVSVVNPGGGANIRVMVNISSLWLTDGGNMSVNDSIELFYYMNSSQMLPNASRSVYTNSTLRDNQSQTGSASILTVINSSEIVLRGYKSIWIPDLSNPQNLSVEIVVRAIGGPVSGILLSDYLPQGATLSGVNVTYYNSSSGNTKNLVNGSDYYVANPTQTTLPDGAYVDVYYYNFSYKYSNWDGNLYDNDSITIRYNVTVAGGGQWVLPTIIGGWDPQYQKHIKTEMYADANVPSFDVILETITKVVPAGDTARALLRMINVGGPKAKVDVFSTYSVKSMEGGLVIEKSETFAVVEQKEKELSLQVPGKTAPGMYTFEAFVTYTGREAVSTDTFEVTGKEEGLSGQNMLYIVGGLIVVVVVVVLLKKR